MRVGLLLWNARAHRDMNVDVPRVSIAMCTYNGARYLSSQLASIEAQTLVVDEVVISDDGSTDETLAILQDYQRRSRAQVNIVRRSAPLGIVANFEVALSRCTGDILLLADQDDVWVPTKVERLVRCFASNPEALLIFSDAELVDAENQSLRQTLWQSLAFSPREQRTIRRAKRSTSALLHKSVVTGATTAIRRELLSHARPLPAGVGLLHDGWLALVASCHGTIVPVDETLVRYRQHSAQHTGAPRRDGVRTLSAVAAAHREHYDFELQLRQSRLLLARLLDPATQQSRRSTGSATFLINHIEHIQARSDARKRRMPGRLISELVKGRYHKHSRGVRSLAKDLLRS